MKRLIVISIATLGMIVAEIASAAPQLNGVTPDFIGDIWGAAKTAGPFTAMMALYFLYLARKDANRERSERQAAQAQTALLLERAITGLNTAAIAVSGATASIDSIKGSITAFIKTMKPDNERG